MVVYNVIVPLQILVVSDAMENHEESANDEKKLNGVADMDLDDLFEEPKTSSLGLKLSWTWTILVV